MTIENENGWNAVELAAQTAELENVETIKVPKTTFDLAVRCAELQAKLKRKDSAVAAAIMWLSLGEVGMASAELTRSLLDI